MQFVCSGFPPQVFLPDPLLILLLLVNTCACSLSGHRENDVNIILIFKGEMINFTSNAREVVAYVQDDDEVVRFGSLDSTQCFLCAGKICSLPELW